MKAKITTLVLTYKRPEYLRRAMQSILGQSYSNLQLSIFDNASGEKTKDVINSFSENDERIKHYCHTSNIGALENHRCAFKSINTPYFSILGDDDLLSIDFYKNAIDVLDSHPKVMFVILNTFIVDEGVNLIAHKECTNRLSFYSGRDGFDEIHSSNIPRSWAGIVFRKDVAKIYEEMDDSHDDGNDIRFLFRAASRYKYAYLSKVGAFCTSHSRSASSSFKAVDLVHQGIQISRYIEIFYDENVSQDIRDRTIFYINRLLSHKPSIISFVKKIIANFIIPDDHNNKKIEENIKDLKYAGYSKMHLITHYLQNSKIASTLAKSLFSSFYKYMLNKRQSRMLSLQKGAYKKYFDYIKDD